MMIYIYFGVAISFFIFAFFIVKARMMFLIRHPSQYDDSYDGHELFLNIFFKKIKDLFRFLFLYIKFAYQKILHFRVQILAKLTSFSERIYMKSRNDFVKEVVKDKKGVPHFWSHLKKYKKEIDEENENRIDDDSMNIIKK